MIRYRQNVIELMAEKGVTTYVARRDKIFTESQLQQLRTDRLVTQETLNKICTILDCQPGFLLEFVPDDRTDQFKRVISAYAEQTRKIQSRRNKEQGEGRTADDRDRETDS